MDKKQGLIILGIIIAIAIVILPKLGLFSSSSSFKTYVDTKELGVIQLELKSPSWFDKLFAAKYLDTSIYLGQKASISDGFTILQGECRLASWEIFIMIGTTPVRLGEFSSIARNIAPYCNLEVITDFTPIQTGTYGLSSTYTTLAGTRVTLAGDNRLTVTSPPVNTPCEYAGWKYFKGITGGYIKINEYLDLIPSDSNPCTDKSDEFMTFCTGSYHITGQPDDVTSASGQLTCTLSTTPGACASSNDCATGEICWNGFCKTNSDLCIILGGNVVCDGNTQTCSGAFKSGLADNKICCDTQGCTTSTATSCSAQNGACSFICGSPTINLGRVDCPWYKTCCATSTATCSAPNTCKSGCLSGETNFGVLNCNAGQTCCSVASGGGECVSKEETFYSNGEVISGDAWKKISGSVGDISPSVIDQKIAGFSSKYYENKDIACCLDLEYTFTDDRHYEYDLNWLANLFGGNDLILDYDIYKCVPEGEAGFCLEFAHRWLKDITNSESCQTNTIIFIFVVVGGGLLIFSRFL